MNGLKTRLLCNHLKIYLMLLLTCFISMDVLAQSSVWKVSYGNNTLYIAGTIHVLGRSDYPLPEEFEKSYGWADTLVFETDISQARSTTFAQKMMQRMLYPPGESLKETLDSETYERLAAYFADKMPMAQVDNLKPAMVVLIMSSLEYQRMGMVIAGVDEHFWMRAIEDEKPTRILETIDEQLDYIVNMGKGKENEMIRNALDEVERIEMIISSLKEAWRSGDRAAIESLILEDMIKDYPELYQSLLVNRNSNWMPHIVEMLEDEPIELVLVGALHLVGEKGLLQMLQNKGYEVTPL